MLYKTYMIHSREELSSCPVFEVKHFMWTTASPRPETFGRMGCLAGEGLYLKMTCLESGPKRACANHRDMVCKDSAMEAFFAFPDANLQSGPPTADSLYFNFEINANGAMYAKYGYGRKGRQFLSDEDYALTGVKAAVEPDRWSVELLVPESVLARIGGLAAFTIGSAFYCNFYKISEDPAIEHYAAYAPIQNETPNFHLPQYFAKAVVAAFGESEDGGVSAD